MGITSFSWLLMYYHWIFTSNLQLWSSPRSAWCWLSQWPQIRCDNASTLAVQKLSSIVSYLSQDKNTHLALRQQRIIVFDIRNTLGAYDTIYPPRNIYTPLEISLFVPPTNYQRNLSRSQYKHSPDISSSPLQSPGFSTEFYCSWSLLSECRCDSRSASQYIYLKKKKPYLLQTGVEMSEVNVSGDNST